MRLVTSIFLVSFVLTGVGCGSSPSKQTENQTSPPTSDADTGRPSLLGDDLRVCGYLTRRYYTASDVVMKGLTCAEAGSTVKRYLDRLRPPSGWKQRGSCGAPVGGGPPGTRVRCRVQLTNRAEGSFVTFLFAGRRGRLSAPNPVVHLEPGDDQPIR